MKVAAFLPGFGGANSMKFVNSRLCWEMRKGGDSGQGVRIVKH